MVGRKGVVELSVKSIVILVIAIIVLALLIFFTKTRFTQTSNHLTVSEPEAPSATTSEPVTVSRENIVVNPGEDVVLKVKVYATQNISVNDTPIISCPPNSALVINPYTIQVTGKDIPAGQTGEYTMTVSIPNAPKGTYLCSLDMESNNAVEQNGILIESEPLIINKDIVFEVK